MIGITGATLQLGLPALCNGANLAFRRQSFAEVKGYEGISHTDSGDDVLLMQKMARQWKDSIYFLKSNRAVVYTFAQHGLSAFTRQRIRWASKSKANLDKRVVFILSMVYLFNLSLISSAVLSFFNSQYLILLIFQMTLKLVLEFSFLGMVTAYFGQRKLLWLFLPAQLLHILYIVVIGALGNVMQTTWKGRRIR
jgi:cellulose synthase/poly-beta-1,6-N-acetylglucosamine synthase-like glycosyltransferase